MLGRPGFALVGTFQKREPEHCKLLKALSGPRTRVINEAEGRRSESLRSRLIPPGWTWRRGLGRDGFGPKALAVSRGAGESALSRQFLDPLFLIVRAGQRCHERNDLVDISLRHSEC